MARLEILTFPDERLKQVSQPVETFDDRLRQFLRDLEETMDLLMVLQLQQWLTYLAKSQLTMRTPFSSI